MTRLTPRPLLAATALFVSTIAAAGPATPPVDAQRACGNLKRVCDVPVVPPEFAATDGSTAKTASDASTPDVPANAEPASPQPASDETEASALVARGQ